MAETGYKQALAEVVAKARAQELQLRTEEDQLDLFGAVAPAVQTGQVQVANWQKGMLVWVDHQVLAIDAQMRPRGFTCRATAILWREQSRSRQCLYLADGVLAAFAQEIGPFPTVVSPAAI
jgi:hypothetical protein